MWRNQVLEVDEMRNVFVCARVCVEVHVLYGGKQFILERAVSQISALQKPSIKGGGSWVCVQMCHC